VKNIRIFCIITVVLIGLYLLPVIIGNVWTQIWVKMDKNRPLTDDEKVSLGHTGKLEVYDRIWLSGGYDPDPRWLAHNGGHYATVESFIPGQNTEPAVIARLDKKITVENTTGDILVMELRWEGTRWGDEGVVHLELCDFAPEHKPWKERRQGKWIESHASYRKIKE
jgi:hypothetical protein